MIAPRTDAAAIPMHEVTHRWLAIALPWWPSDLARRRRTRADTAVTRDRGHDKRESDATPNLGDGPRDAPLLIHRERRGANEVVATCPHAHTAGARVGMPLAQAKALCGLHAIELEWTPEADARALRRLARWCTRYAPMVMPLGASRDTSAAAETAIDGVTPFMVIDVTGCERVHGGEPTLAARVLRDLHRRGVHAQVAIASTQRAALVASTVWPCRVLDHDPRRAAETLAELPLRTLRLSPDTLEALREVNVRRIGEAMALPRTGAADRFGPELFAAIDALRGDRVEPFEPLPHARSIVIEQPFDGPTTRIESIELAIRESLDRFCAKLARRGRGVRLLELTLLRVDALPIVESLPLGRPSRSAAHLWTLLRPRAERANMGFGVEGVRLRSLIDAPLAVEQRRWHLDAGVDGGEDAEGADDAEAARQIAEMIDQMIARLGPDAVRIGDAASAGISTALRPTVIFPRVLAAEVVAEPASAQTSDGSGVAAPHARRPLEVRWPGGGGRVLRCDGPERHLPKWWLDHGQACGDATSGQERDCWRVQTADGRWLWLLHRRPDRWSVIGAWA